MKNKDILNKAIETNSTQCFCRYTISERLIDIEKELIKLREERIELLKALKAEKCGVSMSHPQPIASKLNSLD